jgi:hypothetical protein
VSLTNRKNTVCVCRRQIGKIQYSYKYFIFLYSTVKLFDWRKEEEIAQHRVTRRQSRLQYIDSVLRKLRSLQIISFEEN